MHQTRKQILDVLQRLGTATVEQIVGEIEREAGRTISTVTVRYHLNILIEDGLVSAPKCLERGGRGRPQHAFALTLRARGQHHNYAEVLSLVLQTELGAGRTPDELAGALAEQLAEKMPDIHQAATREERMNAVVDFLNARGYQAMWENVDAGIVLTTMGCPYHDVANRTWLLCAMDMRLIEKLVGVPAQRLTRLSDGDDHCSYWFALE